MTVKEKRPGEGAQTFTGDQIKTGFQSQDNRSERDFQVWRFLLEVAR